MQDVTPISYTHEKLDKYSSTMRIPGYELDLFFCTSGVTFITAKLA